MATSKTPDDSWATRFLERDARRKFYLRLLATDGVSEVAIVRSFDNGLSGAFTDLCEVVSEQGTPQRLQVLKLSSLADAEREGAGARQVMNHLPREHCVHLLDVRMAEAEGTGVVRYEFAASSLRPNMLLDFLTFVDKTSDQGEVGRFVEIALRALSQALAPVKRRTTSIAEICQHFESVRGKRFWSGVVEGFETLRNDGKVTAHRSGRMLLDFPFKTLSNPFSGADQVHKAWNSLFPGAWGAQGHGDLNPRNILAAHPDPRAPFVPVLIDYHRFGGPVPLALDFARMEAGIQIKTLKTFIQTAHDSPTDEDLLTKYEKWVNDHDSLMKHVEMADASAVPSVLPKELKRAAFLVSGVRKTFLEAVGAGDDPSASYFACLMLWYFNYVRPGYRTNGVLTEAQQLFALFCACRIYRRHFVYPARF